MANDSKTIRVGVFSTLTQADAAVQKLLDAGFTRDDIAVFCHEDHVPNSLRDVVKQEPKALDAKSAVTGGAIGAGLGGLATVVGLVSGGGALVLAAGGFALWAGGVAGGLIGAMAARGVEKADADFYDQALDQGKSLVAVQPSGDDPARSLAKAEQALQAAGAETLDLPTEPDPIPTDN